MNAGRRSFAGPIGFILAVIGAAGVFVVALTEGPLMALGFAAFAAAVFWAFNSDDGGVYCLIFAALFEAIYKSVTANMITMLVKDMFLGIMLLRLFWVSQREREFRWLHQPFTAAAVCFVAYCVALIFSPSTRSALLALAGLRAWVLWMPVYFPFYHYFDSVGKISRLLGLLLLIMLPVSAYGIIQGNIGYDHLRVLPNFYKITQFYQSDYHPEDDASEGVGGAGFEANFSPLMNVRACSIHISPGSFGAMCAILVLLSLGYAAYTRSPSMRVLAILSGLAAAGGLLASGSRAPMMGLAVGLVAMTLVARRRAGIVVGVVFFALVSVFFLRDVVGGGALRLEKRLSMDIVIERALMPMERGIRMAMDHPFGNGIATGVGMGRVFYQSGLQTADNTQWVENEFGRALAELGFFGTALWLFMVIGIVWRCVRAIGELGPTPEGLLAAGMFGAMMSVFAQLSVGSALYGAHSGIYFWVCAAAIVRLAEHLAAARRESTDTPDEALRPTGSLGSPVPAHVWRQPRRSARPAPPPAVPPNTGGNYRRAPGAPPGPRPGAPRE
jgi:hypothetical protein